MDRRQSHVEGRVVAPYIAHIVDYLLLGGVVELNDRVAIILELHTLPCIEVLQCIEGKQDRGFAIVW